MSSLYVNGETGQVGIGTSDPSNLLHVEVNGNTPGNVEIMTRIENVEFPPVATSNVGFVADYGDTMASIDVGTPMTLVEFPPVGLTSATTTAGPITIAVSGAFYGNGNYIVTASTVADATSYAPWKVFNKTPSREDNIDIWASFAGYDSGIASSPTTTISGISTAGSWIQIQLPTSIILKQYQILPRAGYLTNQAPISWKIAGSIDGSTWIFIDQRTNITNWVNNTYNTFITTNTYNLNYYRIVISNVASGNTVAFGEWKLFADIPLPTTAREYPPLSMTAKTSYLNGTYGEGTYVASSSGNFNASYLEYLAFDKSVVGDPNAWFSTDLVYNASGVYIGTIKTYTTTNNVYSGEWLQLKLASPIKLTSYQLSTTNNPYAPKQWYIVGSLDGVSWELVDFQTAQTAWTNGAYRSYTISSQISYNYFRIIITNNNHTVLACAGIAEWKLFGTQSTYPKYRATLPATTSTYSTGTYTTYANTIYNATTVDASPPLFLTDKTLTNPWRTGASNYTSTVDASPVPTIFFELPSPIRLDTYTMSAPDVSSAPSTWNVYGSNLGAVDNWSLLDARSSITTAWQTSLTQTFANTNNQTAYNFFKFDLLRNCSATANVISLSELRLGGDKITSESRISVGPDGRVGINTPPALMDRSSALTVSGNMTVAGNINAGNLGMFRNRIINGDMRIDQRNAGVAATISGSIYTADRWIVHDTAASASVTAQRVRAPSNPYGFPYALSIVNTVAQASLGVQEYCGFEQRIEGYNVDDFMWGGAYAEPVTVSFVAYSTVAGTYSMSVRNATNTASFVSTFAMPVANQWTRIEKIIPGETVSSWNIDNTLGLALNITLAAGTNWQTGDINRWTNSSRAPSGFGYIAATGMTNFMATVNGQFYLTGVQMEKGTLATGFERRPYGLEFQLCQRYLYKPLIGIIAYGYLSTTARASVTYPVQMRALVNSLSITNTSTFEQLTIPGTSDYNASNGSRGIERHSVNGAFIVISGTFSPVLSAGVPYVWSTVAMNEFACEL